MPRGSFKQGNKFGKGRPPGSKNQLERIRGRILRIVKRRIFREKDLESVTTPELLKFLASIMPRDFLTVQAPQVNYISNIPREQDVIANRVDLLPVETTVVLNNEEVNEIEEEDGLPNIDSAGA